MEHDVTDFLKSWNDGDKKAAEKLFALIYDELKSQARIFLSRERSDHTLQPTALVHEAFLKLVDQNNVEWQNRAHFFGVAATMMRRILIDHARAHFTGKRGGSAIRLSVDDVNISTEERASDLLALDEALEKLAEFDERKSKIVELKFFGGLNEEEIAGMLDVSTRTIQREWKKARLWLLSELDKT